MDSFIKTNGNEGGLTKVLSLKISKSYFCNRWRKRWAGVNGNSPYTDRGGKLAISFSQCSACTWADDAISCTTSRIFSLLLPLIMSVWETPVLASVVLGTRQAPLLASNGMDRISEMWPSQRPRWEAAWSVSTVLYPRTCGEIGQCFGKNEDLKKWCWSRGYGACSWELKFGIL